MNLRKEKCVFLDRDGVINEDKNYVFRIKDFEFKPGIFDALKHILSKNYLLFIITNQSGIGRGYYSVEDFKTLTKHMLKKLSDQGIEIKEVLYCPHKPEEHCKCRKPKPFLINEAITKYNIDSTNSWMIGDQQSDIQAALNAGITNTILLNENRSSEGIERYTIENLAAIKKIIK